MADLLDVSVLTHAERAIGADQVLALYQTEAWWPERAAEQVNLVLGRYPAVAAWHEGELVGFARAVTDGVLRAYLEDVIVAPGWRGRGIGRALLDRLIGQLTGIPVVTLFCAPDLAGYYAGSSFVATRQTVMHRARRT